MSTHHSFTDPVDDLWREGIQASQDAADAEDHEYHSRRAALEDFPREDAWNTH